ncbi:MAG TPA: DUF6600 domain-containing protein [Candidatus Eisenbacteria bacterium]|jgi:flagellar biosynthesis GTPase FlhF|nr:DUF6600 domain-containing protein [Candidatus Eisenbacteria bacterium]
MRNHALKLFSMLSLVLALALLAPTRAAAQDQYPDNGDNGDDPPSRVARLSHADGSVSFNPAGTDDWVAAVINRPMTTGDKLWSDNGSRAELHIGSASLRIGSTTGFSFLNLTDNVAQVQLTEGTLRVRVKRLEQNETFEIDTPNLAFSVLRPGTYRVDVNESGDSTVVAVMGGEGEVTGGGQAYSVHAGQTATFQGTDQLDADVQSYGDQDNFDQWCADRDRREDRSVSARYVSDDAIGYEDLDDYGGWRPVPDYGQVWFPHTTVVGWAPYRYGHWVYIAPWGYTWVEDEPWGFAPFHYGRWVTVGGVWGWVPCAPRAIVGVEYVRPVYAPALVAWVGGPHFAVGVAVGGASNVGWFPLGPREVYYPSYRVSRTYVTNVNVYNTRVINRTVVNNYYNTVVVNKQVNNVTYVNQRVNGAVTATSTTTFVSGRSVARDSVRVDQREIARTQATYGGPAIPPTRQAVVGAGAPVRSAPPARIVNRTVVARTAPPPAPVAFDRQQSAIRENGGRPLAVSQMRQIQTTTPQNNARAAVRVAPAPRTVTPVQPRNTRVQTNQPNNQPNGQPNNQPNGQPNFNNRNVQQQNNRNVQQQQNNNVNRAPAAVNPPPTNNPPANNAPNNPANNANNGRQYNNRPPNSRPANNNVNPQLEQKQNQQLEQLRQRQDQERQKVEQHQVQEQQKLQQRNADEQRLRQTQQRQQQQLQHMEQHHDVQQQKLEQRQTQERVRSAPPAQQQQTQPRNEKNEKPPKQDRPH